MTGAVAVFRDEVRRIFVLKPVFAVIVLAAVIYAFFYPQPYLNEVLRRVPIAVVDHDGTTASRTLARRVDATSDVAVAMVLPDLPTAERAVFARQIYGILLIPDNFERDLLHGRASPLALYGDAGYFLVYQRIAGAVSAVARTLGAEIETARLVGVGVDPAAAAAAADPMPLTAIALFNPQGGYATYVVPAALILILQQTLLIGVGLLGTTREAVGASAGPLATVAGKSLAYLAVQAPILPFYLLGVPYLYDLPRLGAASTILAFAVPFVLAVGLLGLVVAAALRDPLMVQLTFASVGLPFFFLAGFSWPGEAMPEAVRALSLVLPSTSAIDGLVRVSQLGASLSEVRPQFLTLWALTAAYGALAVIAEARRRRAAPGSPDV